MRIKRKNNNYKLKVFLAASVIINFIINILVVSFVCYREGTKNICFIVFIVSLLWEIVSLYSSYNLNGKYSKYLFYLNLIILLFITKLWFVYF